MKYLIVGLGNIGAEYRNTRHNIGFMVLDALAKASNLVFADGRYGATGTPQAIHLYESQRKCRALLDAEGEHRLGERIDCGR